MRSSLRVGIVLVLVTLWSVGISWAQDGLTKRDRQGPVTVTVTPAPPAEAGTPLKVKVVLDTHSVALDAVKGASIDSQAPEPQPRVARKHICSQFAIRRPRRQRKLATQIIKFGGLLERLVTFGRQLVDFFSKRQILFASISDIDVAAPGAFDRGKDRVSHAYDRREGGHHPNAQH